MSQYFLILVWMGIAAMITSILKLRRPETVLGTTEYRYNLIWAFLIFIPVLLMAGLRTGVGDTGGYRRTFLNYPSTISGIMPYLETEGRDKGFGIFQILLKTVIGNNDVLFFMIIAAFQSFCVIKFCRKYSENYMLSIFFFIASTWYISWMFNGMRQFTAVAMTLACTGFILRKKYIPAIIVILLASTIHGSALVMLPAIFAVQGKACNKWTILLMLAILTLILFGGQMAFLLENTQYSQQLTTGVWETDDGAHPLRVLFGAIPAILALLYLKKIRAENNPVINLCVNMSVISLGISIVAIFTSGIFVGRLPIYFSMYDLILLPWLLNHMFEGSNRKVAHIAIVIVYVMFYYYQMDIAWRFGIL